MVITTTEENGESDPPLVTKPSGRVWYDDPKFRDGRMLSTYDVENMLIAFMAVMTGFLVLSLIIIVVIRIHYKAKADEMIHDMEIQRQAKKSKTPSPFAQQLHKEQLDDEEYIAAAKVRDKNQCLYWKGEQIAAILHHAAMAPVLPPLDTPENNVHISNISNIK
ncbi:hypothetical protein Y032_0243g3490 [Ancylostoma ceylanicum]|uniref:Uncharacterized protein n=1 Tax=Ancylostoma ceylanicum TaxID=53326 RepID=A0A016SDF8_9BILA|nr:hypothetical protein Y032_0243g3490 [Ancylostoma ceylanicum]